MDAMSRTTEVDKLRSLAQLDVDAIGAYDAAIAHVKQPLVSERLNEFRADHVRHVQQLNAFLVEFGAEPVDLRPDLKGAAMKGLTAMTSLMGTEASLVAMLGNEELHEPCVRAGASLRVEPRRARPHRQEPPGRGAAHHVDQGGRARGRVGPGGGAGARLSRGLTADVAPSAGCSGPGGVLILPVRVPGV